MSNLTQRILTALIAAPVAMAEPAAGPAAAEPAVDVGLPPGKCPECEYVNPTTNRFCASCGFRLDDSGRGDAVEAVDDEDGCRCRDALEALVRRP